MLRSSLLRRSLACSRHVQQPTSITPFQAYHYSKAASPTKDQLSTPASGKAAKPDTTHTYTHDRKSEPTGTPVPAQKRKPTLSSFSLDGKTAVVTGGARGLGLVMAQALVLSGADVALVDMNLAGAQEAATRLTSSFTANHPDERVPKITAHGCDVADPASVEACMRDILSSHGKVTTLLTSAGFTENFAAEEYPPDRFRKLMQVNVDGTFLFATAVARHIFARTADAAAHGQPVDDDDDKGGAMIFVGSMSAVITNVPQPQAPYNASKAAVRQLAASLAVEWAQRGIRVNCISPGYMLTALTEEILAKRPDFKREWTSRIPMGRMGKPEDLMGAVTFLASDASSYITGADVRIDGGYTLI